MADLTLRLPAATRRDSITERLTANLWAGCAAVAVLAWLYTVHRSNYGQIGALGLVTILSPAYFAGVLLVGIGFGVELVRPRLREGRLLCLTLVLILFLFGTACAVEPVAALPSSWIHAGYVQYLFSHGHALNGFDAEFSWPGMFSMGALLVSFMGQTDAMSLLRWFPLVIELLYLPAMLAIARASGVGRRAGWLGIAIFYATDWIYQDYFSPQAVNLLFFLGAIAVVLTIWRPVALRVRKRRPSFSFAQRRADTWEVARLRRLLGDGATTDWPVATVLGVLGVLVLVFAASAMSHQLTPYAIVLALTACLLTRRLARPELIAIAFLLCVGWLSLGASNFWYGHLSLIFGSFGQLSTSIQQNASSRVVGAASHRLIVDARILVTLALFGLAAIGAARRATASRTLEMLAAAPFVLLAAQSYGGEGLLRVALLSGPFAGLLAAAALLPTRSGQLRPFVPSLRLGRRGRQLLAAACCVVLVTFATVTTVVRGGNDAYETFTTDEVAAATYVYANATPNDTIGLVAPYAPLGQLDVGSIGVYVAVPQGNVPLLHRVVGLFVRARTGVRPHRTPLQWILLGKAQEAWGEILAGYPPGWEAAVQRGLVKSGDYSVVLSLPNATVLRATPAFLAAAAKPPTSTTTTATTTTTTTATNGASSATGGGTGAAGGSARG